MWPRGAWESQPLVRVRRICRHPEREPRPRRGRTLRRAETGQDPPTVGWQRRGSVDDRTGWALRLCQNEEVRWLNEGRPPSPRELEQGVAVLHAEGKGYLLCPSCGRMLHQPPLEREARGGRRRAAGNQGPHDNNGHGEACPRRGESPTPLAITTAGKAEILRLLLPVPQVVGDDQWLSWGLSLGYSLLYGMQHYCMLGGCP